MVILKDVQTNVNFHSVRKCIQLTKAVSSVWGCLKLTISDAKYFLTLAKSAFLAPSRSEWPLYSSKTEKRFDTFQICLLLHK